MNSRPIYQCHFMTQGSYETAQDFARDVTKIVNEIVANPLYDLKNKRPKVSITSDANGRKEAFIQWYVQAV